MTPEYVWQHITERGEEYVEPSVHLMRHWFRVLNTAEFGNLLPTPRFHVYEDFDAKEAGWCECEGTACMIRINAAFNRSRGEFLATMMHEMLHLMQYGLTNDMGHDDWFNDRALLMTYKYGVDV